MLTTIQNALKTKEIRMKLLYVLIGLVIVRIGCNIPIPGTKPDVMQNLFNSNQSLGFLDVMTGGSFSRMSIFALNITPYITASIILQLLTIAIPRLEEMQKDGEDGRKKINEYTRYLSIALAVIEGAAIVIGFRNQGLFGTDNPQSSMTTAIVVAVAALTAGAAFMMWLGEQITEKGVGNGISIILLINIVARIPNDLSNLYQNYVAKPTDVTSKIIAAVIILAIIVAMFVFIVFLQDGERRIPVQYSKKMAGRKMVGGQSSNIPLKVNTAGVIPIIFASSIMSFPSIILSFVGKSDIKGIGGTLIKMLNSNNWFDKTNPVASLGLILYIVLVIFFAYFYTSITFNPMEVADNMKKQGGFIPGIRPGKSTVDYLNNLLSYIIFIGAAGLTIVAVIPFFFNGFFKANVSFGGTSLIIIASVILETLKQIESMMLVRNYKGFLND